MRNKREKRLSQVQSTSLILSQRGGELTTQQIVALTILIVSFIVILFLLFRLNLGEETNKELCRNSVLLKSKSIFPEDAIKLNCYRHYKCITSDGSCEGLNNPDVAKVETVDEIYSEISGEMTDCWYMFGEGKVDYIGSSVTELTKNNYCSICSQISFDNSLAEIKEVKNGAVSKDELYKYMQNTKISGQGFTYLEYLFGTNDLEKIKSDYASKAGVGSISFGDIKTGKQSFVVMGITRSASNIAWTGIGAVAGGAIGGVAIFLTGPPGWIAGAIILGTATAGGIAGSQATEINAVTNIEIGGITVKGIGIGNQFLSPTVIEADSEKFKALNCENILTFS